MKVDIPLLGKLEFTYFIKKQRFVEGLRVATALALECVE
jgi:hypothetical protein